MSTSGARTTTEFTGAREFGDGLLAAVESIADSTLEELADGRRYPIERAEHDQGADSSE